MSSQQFEGGRLVDPHTTTLVDAAEGRAINPDGMSLGVRRVRESFTQRSVDLVNGTVDLIDLCVELEREATAYSTMSEQVRLIRLAQTAYEEATMWVVKAATTPK